MGFDGYEAVSPTVLNSVDGLKDASFQYLDKTRQHLGDETIQTMVVEGDFAETILRTAEETQSVLLPS